MKEFKVKLTKFLAPHIVYSFSPVSRSIFPFAIVFVILHCYLHSTEL